MDIRSEESKAGSAMHLKVVKLKDAYRKSHKWAMYQMLEMWSQLSTMEKKNDRSCNLKTIIVSAEILKFVIRNISFQQILNVYHCQIHMA